MSQGRNHINCKSNNHVLPVHDSAADFTKNWVNNPETMRRSAYINTSLR